MIKTSEVDMLLATVIKRRERDRAIEEGLPTLYGAMMEASKAFGIESPTLPEQASKAVTKFIERALFDLAKDANEKFARMTEFINELPADGADAYTVDELRNLAIEAAQSYLFTMSMCKAALADADYAYLAEVALEAGQEAAVSQ